MLRALNKVLHLLYSFWFTSLLCFAMKNDWMAINYNLHTKISGFLIKTKINETLLVSKLKKFWKTKIFWCIFVCGFPAEACLFAQNGSLSDDKRSKQTEVWGLLLKNRLENDSHSQQLVQQVCLGVKDLFLKFKENCWKVS